MTIVFVLFVPIYQYYLFQFVYMSIHYSYFSLTHTPTSYRLQPQAELWNSKIDLLNILFLIYVLILYQY